MEKKKHYTRYFQIQAASLCREDTPLKEQVFLENPYI